MTLHPEQNTVFLLFYFNRFIFKGMEFTEEGSLLNSKVKLTTAGKSQQGAVDSPGISHTGEKEEAHKEERGEPNVPRISSWNASSINLPTL